MQSDRYSLHANKPLQDLLGTLFYELLTLTSNLTVIISLTLQSLNERSLLLQLSDMKQSFKNLDIQVVLIESLN